MKEIAKAVAEFDAVMDSLGTCGDGNCLVKKPVGMHTNGGCRCLERGDYSSRTRRFVSAARRLRNAIIIASLTQDTPPAMSETNTNPEAREVIARLETRRAYIAAGGYCDIDAFVNESWPNQVGFADAIIAALAAEGKVIEDDWRSIDSAPKDGTVIWGAIHADLYPRIMPAREDLERWNGVQVPLRHPGIYENDGRKWDHGWNVAAPVGHGGFPDTWIAGWKPIRHPTPTLPPAGDER